MSKNIRKEMTRFEKQRVKDFKTTVIHYLETLMNNQQQVWRGILAGREGQLWIDRM